MNRILACVAGGVLCVAIGCGGDGAGDGLGGSVRDASVGGMGGSAGASFGGASGTGGATACELQPVAGGELSGICRGDEAQCNSGAGLTCVLQIDVTVGGPNDPIADYPPGETTTYDTTLFPGDFCSFDPLVACDAAACDSLCGACDPVFDVCMRRCDPSADDNSACRDGYRCDLLLGLCDTGCTTDDDCRVSRPDTNGDGMLDPFDPTDNPDGDRLVYNTASTSVCNPQTFRCDHDGTPGAQAGQACDDDEQCEPNGDCLDGTLGFTDGYCTKFRCDLDGNACSGDAVCQVRGFGLSVCAQGCKVGEGGVDGMPSTYLNNTQGCRDEYTCVWDGLNDDTAQTNGACLPGVFNDVTTPNVGDTCAEDSECYSPFGQGVCDPDFDCTVFDCAAPGMPADVCGEDSVCVAVANLAVCLRACESADACALGRACVPLDDDQGAVCFPACLDSTECRTGEQCDTTTGLCRAP